jgi:hypothetical protein
MKKISLAVAITMSLFSLASIRADDPALVQGGQAVGVIVVPSTASPQLRASAEFLQTYVAKSTGATLPIETEAGGKLSIHLGETDLVKSKNLEKKDLGKDGFVLKRLDEQSFAVVGGSDWGTEFGVYEFLERYLGVRWLASTELFTEVPAHQTVPLPQADETVTPTFLSRELFPIVVPGKPDDTRRNSAPLWYNLYDDWGRVNKLMARVEFHHNLEFLFPPSKFGKTHPEFYPILNGQRFVPPDDLNYQWQPNFSAPNISRVAADEIISYFDKNPEKDSYSLGINDSYRFDESPESKARRSGKKNSIGLEDISDDYYQWTNEVMEFVHEKYPEKRLGLLAYLQVLEPPTRVKVNPSIVPFITYENTRWENPEYREKMQKVTLAWGEAAPNLGWYDYVWGSFFLIPRFFPHAEQNALKWGAAHQVKYYYAEAVPSWGEGPNLWILTKLLWNPNQDVDALLDDWYTAAVGPAAAPKLRAYYEIWEKFWEKDILPSRWYSAVNLWHDYTNSMYANDVPVAYLSQSDKLLDEAVALADTPTRKARAEALRSIWKVFKASTLARQGDDLWKSADLQTEADAEAYLSRCSDAIFQAEERLRLMSALSEDPLFAHTIFRFTITMPGEDWGTASLWPLLPWVNKSAKVRSYLETLAAKSDDDVTLGTRFDDGGNKVPMRHLAPKTAREILTASRGELKQLMQNPSFEDGLKHWPDGPYKVTSKEAAEGKSSLRIASTEDSAIIQAVPYVPGTYFVKVSVRPSENFKKGKVSLSVVARNDVGEQIGPLLPTGSPVLHPGKWSTLIFPFTLGTYSAPATKLQVVLDFAGFSDKESIDVDDFGVFQVDDVARKWRGAGPDGM